MLSPIKKGSMVIGIVGIIIFFLHMFESEETFENRKQLPEVESIEELKEFFYTKNPGLKRAERLGVVKSPNEEFPIPNSRYKLYIDQIWYGVEDVTIFYSVDLGRDIHRFKYADESSSIYPWVHFSFDPIDLEVRHWNNQAYFKRLGPREGIIYQERLYHQVTVAPLVDKEWIKLKEVDKALLRDLRIEIDGKVFKMGDVELDIEYVSEQTPRINVPINQEMKIGEGKFLFERLDIGVYDQRLYFSMEDISRIPYMMGVVVANGEELVSSLGSNLYRESDGEYFVALRPFNAWPKELQMAILEIVYMGEESYSFDVDVSTFVENVRMHESRSEQLLNLTIGSAHHSEVIVKDIVYLENGLVFTIVFEQAKLEESKNEQLIMLHPYDQYSSAPKSLEDRVEWESNWRKKEPLVIEIRNEKGEAVQWHMFSQGPSERLQIIIDEEELNKAKTLHVTLHQLPYRKVYDWTATVDIEAEDQYVPYYETGK